MSRVLGITGATGELGGRVARRLAAAGAEQRLIVRDATRAPVLEGATVVEFGGYDDGAGMRAAFAGVETLLLVSGHESADRLALHRRAADAAADAGVGRVVYTSFVNAAADATFTYVRDHFHTEEHIRARGLGHTFSRQNLYLDFVPMLGGRDGIIRGPAGHGRIAPVLRDDVADALAAMLTQPGHEGATYTLTGPVAFSLAEIAERTGQRYEDETVEEAYASRASYGAPDWEVEGWVTTYLAIANGEMDIVTDHVERLTGHPPARLEDL